MIEKEQRLLVFVIETACEPDMSLHKHTIRTLREYADALEGVGFKVKAINARGDQYLATPGDVGFSDLEKWEDSRGNVVKVVHGMDALYTGIGMGKIRMQERCAGCGNVFDDCICDKKDNHE